MAEHRIRKNRIIYIIPTDELFLKWENGEAFIDDYGRLMNRKTHRVLKELKHYVEEPAKESIHIISPSPRNSVGSQIKERVKDDLHDKAVEAIDVAIDRAVDKFFYEVLPGIWQEHIVPFCRDIKYALTTTELKADTVIQANKSSNTISPTQQKTSPPIEMTPEEINVEKRKAVYHWLAMLDSLRKLQSAEVMDMNATLEQLTNPAMLQKINSYLDANPKLLEMDEYLTLREMLGRDLYEEKQFVPIQAKEIEIIAATYEQEAAAEKSED